MRTDSKADVKDVPRWTLWLVAVVCFGPLTLMCLLGVLYLLLLGVMLAAQLAQPERLAVELSELIWDIGWPIAQVIGGFIGLVGVVTGAAWLLATSRQFLLAASVRPDDERRGSTIRRERRDDWRLDA